MAQSDEEMIMELKTALEDGTFEEHYAPAKVRPSKNRSVSFAIRLSPDEVKEFSAAAERKGMTLADFMRNAARGAMGGDVDIDRAAAIGAAREHARELNEALSRL